MYVSLGVDVLVYLCSCVAVCLCGCVLVCLCVLVCVLVPRTCPCADLHPLLLLCTAGDGPIPADPGPAGRQPDPDAEILDFMVAVRAAS